MTLSPKFDEALTYAADLHREQVRKGTSVPYVSHLLVVAGTVLENEGSETEAIAALLHDAVEDQGGLETAEEIRQRFGAPVAEIVKACSDSLTRPKSPWRETKEAYVERIRHAPEEVRRVSGADKLHNARAILRDLRTQGPELWERFKGGRDGTLWYYRALADAFGETGPRSIARELDEVVSAMEAEAGRAPGD